MRVLLVGHASCFVESLRAYKLFEHRKCGKPQGSTGNLQTQFDTVNFFVSFTFFCDFFLLLRFIQMAVMKQ